MTRPDVLLSVLVPGLVKRIPAFGAALLDELQEQAAKHSGEVEVLGLLDNQVMSTGLKRRHLVAMARGRFFSMIDDDDWPEKDYVSSILGAIKKDPAVDVVTFEIAFSVDGDPHFRRRFRINGPWPPQEVAPGLTEDRPSHTMCWRRDLVADIEFADRFHGEDVDWVLKARPRLKTETSIDRVLYNYLSRSSNVDHARLDREGGILPLEAHRMTGIVRREDRMADVERVREIAERRRQAGLARDHH